MREGRGEEGEQGRGEEGEQRRGGGRRAGEGRRKRGQQGMHKRDSKRKSESVQVTTQGKDKGRHQNRERKH